MTITIQLDLLQETSNIVPVTSGMCVRTTMVESEPSPPCDNNAQAGEFQCDGDAEHQARYEGPLLDVQRTSKHVDMTHEDSASSGRVDDGDQPSMAWVTVEAMKSFVRSRQGSTSEGVVKVLKHIAAVGGFNMRVRSSRYSQRGNEKVLRFAKLEFVTPGCMHSVRVVAEHIADNEQLSQNANNPVGG